MEAPRREWWNKVLTLAALYLIVIAAVTCAYLRVPWRDSISGILMTLAFAPIAFIQTLAVLKIFRVVEFDKTGVRYRFALGRWKSLAWNEIDDVHESRKLGGVRLGNKKSRTRFVAPWLFDHYRLLRASLIEARGDEGLQSRQIRDLAEQITLPFAGSGLRISEEGITFPLRVVGRQCPWERVGKLRYNLVRDWHSKHYEVRISLTNGEPLYDFRVDSESSIKLTAAILKAYSAYLRAQNQPLDVAIAPELCPPEAIMATNEKSHHG